MSELLLPAATAQGGDHAAFDLQAHAERLRSTPKEHYAQAADPEPPPEPEPEPAPETGPTDPPGGQDGPRSTAEEGASARFIIDMYDAGVSKLCEALVDDPGRYPATHFAMEPLLKDHAAAQLEKGLREGDGKWKLPWWVALLVVLLFHGGLTWMAVRSARRERAERKRAESERRAQQRGGAPPPAPGPPAPEPTVTLHDRQGRPLGTVPQEPRRTAPCAQCGQPVKRAGRKYCSQRCAGLATSARRRARTDTTNHGDA